MVSPARSAASSIEATPALTDRGFESVGNGALNGDGYREVRVFMGSADGVSLSADASSAS